MKLSKLVRLPEAWDVLGLIAWIFLIAVSVFSSVTHQTFDSFTIKIILIIAILGAIVDGTMVYLKFFK